MCYRILSTGFVCLLLAACDGQEQTEAINKTTEVISKPTEVISKTTEVKTVPEQAPEKSTQQKPLPALNLSVDNLSIDHQGKDDDIFNIDKKPTETHSDLFETLSKDQTEPGINVSGKLLTDEEKLDNKEYLDSVEGLQINIEGSFQ